MHRRLLFSCLVLFSGMGGPVHASPQIPLPAPAVTEVQFLSGRGPADALPWEFECTGGRHSGVWTTIPVPSNWELQGFGTYDYGQQPMPKAQEHGLYRLHFKVPVEWQGRHIRLVFDGVMTDATVSVNGRPAGPTHQGAFYRFEFDVTASVRLGQDNLLEVDVAKVSADPDTERGERLADYWVFGGIFRPVYLEAAPAESIEGVAIDAQADGTLRADVRLGFIRTADRLEAQVLDSRGLPAGAPFGAAISGGGTGRAWISTRLEQPALWTAETPQLYRLQLTLYQANHALHRCTQAFGFRTFEVRAGRGLFLNGQRVLLKGIDRHSFRPETGRSLSRENCYEDARMIKAMNLNAVRMSHYPPDAAFLEACDELGLYVLDELSGWHHAHATPTGRILVRAMVERDVNHPSVLFWDNGNEGGFNRDLDGEFALYDPQHRPVLHPWETFSGIDTKHYPTYEDLTKRLEGPNLVMPTEFLHALYDGGGGAGLEDYWRAISSSRFGAGGFIWMFADEGVVRTDQGGRIDVFGTYDPDGVVGPHHEKEGSYFSIRDIYSPVQADPPPMADPAGISVALHNRYAFRSLKELRFQWRLVRFADPDSPGVGSAVLGEGEAAGPDAGPGQEGRLSLALPADWPGADAVELTARFGSDSIWTWRWPTSALQARLAAAAGRPKASAQTAESAGDEVRLAGGGTLAIFNRATGRLKEIRRGDRIYGLSNGPRLVFAHPAVKGDVQWLGLAPGSEPDGVWRLSKPAWAQSIEVDLAFTKMTAYASFRLEISGDGQRWTTIYDGDRREGDGRRYDFPPQIVSALRLTHARRSDGLPIAVIGVRIGYSPQRFPPEPAAVGTVASGPAWIENQGGGGFDRFRWMMREDGSLQLDYQYTLRGVFEYHGISFDHDPEKIGSVRWLGAGPYRVWRNRLRGATLGVYENTRHDLQPGESWQYPEFQGYFGDFHWARLKTDSGALLLTSLDRGDYFRIGTPRISHINTTVDFPSGELSILRAIPPIGSKFRTPGQTGPASRWAEAAGPFGGTLILKAE